MITKDKTLPSANEFTPNIINLDFVLRSADEAIDRRSFIETIRNEYFSKNAQAKTDLTERLKSQQKLAGNVLIGLRNYKLVKPKDNSSPNEIILTATGTKILFANPDEAKNIFAKHIFNELCGIELIESMNTLRSKGLSARKKDALAQELSQLGVQTNQKKQIAPNTTDHTKLATWLQWCGVLDDDDNIVDDVFRSALGTGYNVSHQISNLSVEQKLFLRTIYEYYSLNDPEPIFVKNIVKDASEKFGNFIKRPDQIAVDLIQPIEKILLIEHLRSSEGRGGNSGKIKPTKELLNLDPTHFDVVSSKIPNELGRIRNLNEIFVQLDNPSTYEKGIALEELALHLGNSLGLTFRDFRSRGSETGGAEVDVIFESAGNTFARWLFQCKNTPKSAVHVAAVAKELGMAIMLKANIVCMITTGSFTKTVHDFARKTIESSNIQVLLIDGKILENVKIKGTIALIEEIQIQNQEIARLRAIKN